MNLKNKIKNIIKDSLEGLKKGGVFEFPEDFDLEIEYPEQSEFGDYSTNIALKSSKFLKKSPKDIAKMIKGEILMKDKGEFFKKIDIAGPGFINFYVNDKIFFENVKDILKEKGAYGRNDILKDKKFVIEYTDPNPFKEFHIGHLMPNIIGESISRIYEFSGADVKRVCYQGDVGMHVAMAVYGILNQDKTPEESGSLDEKASFLGACYTYGAKAYKENEQAQKEIKDINKKIFERTSRELMEIYETGKKWSLDYFESIYKRLGTKFDQYFFESETGEFGKKIVKENIEKGVFKESQGAVVFEGEEYGLHTRVFINSDGLPTYEAKELGLAKIKYDHFKYDESVVVTGNEINEYFKVLLKVMSLIYPELAKRTKHIGHGMLRLPTGKMSSRTGDVITAVELLSDIEKHLEEKQKEHKEGGGVKKDKDVASILSVAAIKYTILKQKIGKDIIFDVDRSISFEGDSGIYLLYSYVRTRSVMKKAEENNIEASFAKVEDEISSLEKKLAMFPGVLELAIDDISPHHIVSYLVELAQEFNAYYAKNKIVEDDKKVSYRLALTKAVSVVLENGLELLGIKRVEKM